MKPFSLNHSPFTVGYPSTVIHGQQPVANASAGGTHSLQSLQGLALQQEMANGKCIVNGEPSMANRPTSGGHHG